MKIFLCSMILFFLSSASQINNLEPITPENADQTEEIAVLGRGKANATDWRPDGDVLAVASATGIWLYDSEFIQIDHFLKDTVFTRISWSPSGDYLAGITPDKVLIFTPDSNIVFDKDMAATSISWHPDNLYIAISDDNNMVTVWNSHTGKFVHQLEVEGQYVSWSPDGTRLAVGGKHVWIFDANNYDTQLEIIDKEAEGLVQWNIEGDKLSSWCFDDAMFSDFDGTCIWDAETGELLEFIEVFQVFWTPNMTIYYGSSPFESGAGTQFEIQKQDIDETSYGGYYEQIIALDKYPNLDVLTMLSETGKLIELTLSEGEILRKIPLHSTSPMTVTISPDTQVIASTSESIVSLWNIDAAQHIIPDVTFDIDLGTYTIPRVDVLWDDNSELVTVENVVGGESISRKILRRDQLTGEITETVFSQLGDIAVLPLLTCSRLPSFDLTKQTCVTNGILQVFSLDFEKLLFTTKTDNIITYVIWSTDDTMIATIERWPDDTATQVAVWDVTTGEQLLSYNSRMQTARSLVWSPDNKSIAVLMQRSTPGFVEQAVEIVSIGSSLPDQLDYNHAVVEFIYRPDTSTSSLRLAWSPDNKMYAVSMSDGIRIYHVENTDDPLIIIPYQGVTDLEWSNDGTIIATGGSDGTIRLWGIRG